MNAEFIIPLLINHCLPIILKCVVTDAAIKCLAEEFPHLIIIATSRIWMLEPDLILRYLDVVAALVILGVLVKF